MISLLNKVNATPTFKNNIWSELPYFNESEISIAKEFKMSRNIAGSRKI